MLTSLYYITADIQLLEEIQPDNIYVDNLTTKEENDRFNESIREIMGRRMNFDPQILKQFGLITIRPYVETMKIFGGITMLVTIIGILTLIACIVGVSNIMLVSVKEEHVRWYQKAIGAPPLQFLKQLFWSR